MNKWLTTHFTVNGPVEDEDDVAPDLEMDAEAYDCYDEDGRMVDTLDFSDPAGPMPASESSASDKAQRPLPASSASPPTSQEPRNESTETYGTESWRTPSMHPCSSGKGHQARKPPPVSRGRLNLTALSQRYNVRTTYHFACCPIRFVSLTAPSFSSPPSKKRSMSFDRSRHRKSYAALYLSFVRSRPRQPKRSEGTKAPRHRTR